MCTLARYLAPPQMVDEVFVCSQAMARLTRNARLAAARRAAVLRLAPGELLCRAGQPQDRILVLISGEVSSSRTLTRTKCRTGTAYACTGSPASFGICNVLRYGLTMHVRSAWPAGRGP